MRGLAPLLYALVVFGPLSSNATPAPGRLKTTRSAFSPASSASSLSSFTLRSTPLPTISRLERCLGAYRRVSSERGRLRMNAVQEIHSTVAEAFSAAAAVTSPGTVAVDYQSILSEAAKRALGGGTSGAVAGVAQVITLMWLRTVMNYQYRYGTSTSVALKTLLAQGGIQRLYRGVGFALIQNPLSRFGDTAANAGILAILDTLPQSQSLPLPLKQAMASLAASTWRIAITPVDTLKTTLQVEGEEAIRQLQEKVKVGGPGVLWNGAFAAAAATFVGNYPWFLTYNALDQSLPHAPEDAILLGLLRRAALGVAASGVSDTASNSLRVIKTAKQTSKTPISYIDVTKDIIAKDGVPGLLGRGLQTRLLVNCLQGALFAVVWKAVEKQVFKS